MYSVPDYCQLLKITAVLCFTDSRGGVKEVLFPKALDLTRPKRPRTMFSKAQLADLEREFQENPYLVGEKRSKLAAKLELTDTQVYMIACLRS
ncbi:unnamed protein product [Enterobius vermicularis]|uniref:Homeobox domain-containing protein n=1 Tax=Enterobius vermicularis TaxID=51028 RepID=A0A0N4V162_ENTVE|nr:unnamed protein product [Enterobius vermicularis]